MSSRLHKLFDQKISAGRDTFMSAGYQDCLPSYFIHIVIIVTCLNIWIYNIEYMYNAKKVWEAE